MNADQTQILCSDPRSSALIRGKLLQQPLMPIVARLALPALLLFPAPVAAGVGDPQVRTDHPWYPGELSCSSFDRLFATQAAVYKRVTGRDATTDEDKVLASWLWRNTHYWHGEEGSEDLWGLGFGKGLDGKNREYWTGLFSHGYALCGTTHAQWVAEMNALLGHGRGRVAGAAGHNAFEVFLTGGAYGTGRWVLLDHDLCSVVYAPDGSRLLSLKEVARDWKRLTDRAFKPGRQHGWPVCGLHPTDAGSYKRASAAELLAGYAGPPPAVHLRRGETFRRYLRPGLADGKTFAFWGRNPRAGGIPGPERAETWVNQPDAFYKASATSPAHAGQARFANAVFTYRPDFRAGDYKEAVVGEDAESVTFGFRSPYLIAATPPNDDEWGIYDAGGRNGLVVTGTVACKVSVSADDGATWSEAGVLPGRLDLTDAVKGRRHYRLRFAAPAAALAAADLSVMTVCEANAAVMPHLTDNGAVVHYEAGGQTLVSAGPDRPTAAAHVVAGRFDSPSVTLELATPHGEPAVAVTAAAHVQSSSPPDSAIQYQIEYSADAGTTWRPVVRDWTIPHLGEEPSDFWSQSFCWGTTTLSARTTAPVVRVRFRNSGGKNYPRAEAHLNYRVPGTDGTRVTFAWSDDRGQHQNAHSARGAATWTVPTGKNTRTEWVEFEAMPSEARP